MRVSNNRRPENMLPVHVQNRYFVFPSTTRAPLAPQLTQPEPQSNKKRTPTRGGQIGSNYDKDKKADLPPTSKTTRRRFNPALA